MVCGGDGEFEASLTVGLVHKIVGEDQPGDLVHLEQISRWINIRDLVYDGGVASCGTTEEMSATTRAVLRSK